MNHLSLDSLKAKEKENPGRMMRMLNMERPLRPDESRDRPIWLMRQAGRYLPEYQALRKQSPDFMTFCKTPEWACQATLQPLERFDLDAAIIFSDILTIPDALGFPVHFEEHKGPVLARTLQPTDTLLPLEISSIDYIASAIRYVKPHLKVPLIGFAGSPWTVITYMIEGQSSKTWDRTRAFLYQHPSAVHRTLEHLAQCTIAYLQHQIDAGAQIIMLFDTWGSLLTSSQYKRYSLPYLQIIRQAIPQAIPMILFSKGCSRSITAIMNSGFQGIGLDWHMPIQSIISKSHLKPIALQGHLDPAILLAGPQATTRHTQSMMKQYPPSQRYIVNLGHGILPQTPIESVHAMIQAVRSYSNSEESSKT